MLAGSLEIQLMAGIARLQTDMNQATRVVGSAMTTIESSVAKVRSAFGTLGVGLGVGVFVNLIKGSIDALDHMRDVSKATGILVEDLAGLNLLAKQTGTDFDGLAKGIGKMSVEIGKNPEKFKALGITAKDNTEAFKQFADIFNLLPDIQQRNALAMAVFGKSWAEMAPALSEGSAKIAETIVKGKLLSGVTDEMTDRADQFNDKLAELQTQIGGTRTAIAAGLLPTLTALVDNFTLVKNVVLSLIAAKLAGWAASTVTELMSTVAANKAAAAAAIEKAQADVAAAAVTRAARITEAQANVAATAASLALAEARVSELRAAAIAAGGNEMLAITTNAILPAQARATAASISYQAALSSQAPAQQRATTAAAAYAAALTTLTAAQTTASATGGLAARALGLLGGPIGAITLLLGLGATAWSLWGRSAEDAADKAEDAVNRGLSIAKRLQTQDKFGAGDTGALNEALAGAKQALNTELANFAEAQRAVTSDSRLSAESIARDLVLVEKSYAGAVQKARGNIETLEGAIKKSAAGAGEMTEAQRRATAATATFLKQDEKASKGAADAVAGLILQLKKELDALNALDGESAEYSKLVREITDGTKDWTEAQIAHALALQGEIDDIKRAKKETEDYIKEFKAASDLRKESDREEAEALARMSEARKTFILASQEELEISQEMVQISRLEVSMMNATEAERTKAVELLKAELKVRRDINAAINAGANLSQEDRLLAETNARQSALNRSLAQQVKDEAADALKVQTDMWQSIERTAHDTFISIFDSGKNAFERLRDTLKNTLFDLLYQMTIKKWIIQITAAVGGQGVATSAFGALNVANATGTGSGGGLMNLLGLGSNIGTAVGGGSGGLFGSFASSGIGQALGLSTTAATAGQAATGMFANVISGSSSTAAAGATLTAGGAALSYAIPIIGAAVAAYFLLHKDKVSATSTGDMARLYGPGGMTAEWQGQFGTGAGGAQIDAIYQRFNAVATALGATFDQIGFGLGSNTGKEGKNPMIGLRGYLGGGSAENVIFSSGEVPAAEFEIQASRAILAALKASTLPAYLANVFNTLTPETMDQAQIDAALQFAGALKALREQVSETRQPLDIARDSVKLMSAALKTTATTADEWKAGLLAAIDAGIGPEALAQWQALGQAIEAVNAIVAEAAAVQASLVDRFSTEAERMARAQQTVIDAFAGYGVTIPQTRAEFVALAAAFDPATAEGQRFIGELNGIADAFELITPEVEALAEVVQDTSNVIAINNKRNELQIRLLELQGNATGALTMRRMLEYEAIGQLDQSLLPLIKEIYGLEDAQVAATAATIDHAQAISDAESLLRDAYQREISEKESLIQRMGGYVQSLRQYREQLTFNDPSLSPENRYAGTRQLFEQTSRAAGLGDMDAIGRLQQTSQDFLEASRFYNASSPAFQADMQAVIAAVANSESVASRTVDVAQLQLDALNEQRNAILGVETAVLSVRDALANLESKIIASGNNNAEGNTAMLGAINQVQAAVENVGTEIRRAA